MSNITVGVLALQGAFLEHLRLLKQAAYKVEADWTFREIRTPKDLEPCDALIIPGGESTAISLVAARSELLEPLREFVKVKRKPTWGTCAGLILLAESANRTKKGGQDLIGGLHVRVNRNHFGRQMESFEAPLELSFLHEDALNAKGVGPAKPKPFNGVFIRAPVVEKLLPVTECEQKGEASLEATVIAPFKRPADAGYAIAPVEVLATLPGRSKKLKEKVPALEMEDEIGDIIGVRQGNVFGTSFHPELTDDARIHLWWLQQVRNAMQGRDRG